MLSKVITHILNPLIYLLIGIAVVVFLWGAVEFLTKADSPEGRSEGQKHLLWGIIGLAIIFGVYGILNFIQGTLIAITNTG